MLSIREVLQTHANEFQCDYNISHSWLENWRSKIKAGFKGKLRIFPCSLGPLSAVSLTFEPQEDHGGRMGGTVLEFPYTIISNNIDWLQRNPTTVCGQLSLVTLQNSHVVIT